jgi:8-amino-7-oxononanoate synthase
MNNTPIHERIDAALVKRQEGHLFRTVPPCSSRVTIDLSTNSYLDLHNSAEVASAAKELTKGILHGNCASRLIAQLSPLYEQLEAEIADWKGSPSALVFNSGYDANIGIIQAVCTRDTEVFSDRLNHASIIDGVRLSGAHLTRYAHNDMSDLARRLRASSSNEKLIVTDTVFSMDGDRADLAAICELAGRHHAMVMVDEAHATGIFGACGAGLAEEQDVAGEIDIRMGTLSKAVAGAGGFFAGSTILRDYLVNFARSLMYSTGLPHSVLAHDLTAIRHIRKSKNLGKKLLDTASVFRKSLNDLGFDTLKSDTQIIPCVFRDEKEALACSEYLGKSGIRAPAIRPPTVPRGTARIRLSLHSGLTDGSFRKVLAALSKWKSRHE